MKIGLFVPCYVDQLYPQVAIATLEVLERLGMEVVVPSAQTCCGQPVFNLGHADEASVLARRFVALFSDVECVVAPSGSCAAMVREHYRSIAPADPGLAAEMARVAARTFELCEFLYPRLDSLDFGAPFARRVSIHHGCHHLRELRAGPSGERRVDPATTPDKVRAVLSRVPRIELVAPKITDACCGFGGTFCVSEDALSARMGEDRVDDHLQTGAEVMTSADMSCLMHLGGLIRRQQRPIEVIHVAEILAGRAGA